MKDFHKLLRNVESFSAGQAKIIDYEDDLQEFTVEIIPKDGIYRHGKFDFKIHPNNYPNEAPEVHCLTRIYHPNIDLVDEDEDESQRGEICLNLFDEWTASNDLQDCVQGLLFLLHNPNLEDPLNPLFSPSDCEGEFYEAFVSNVRKSLEGCEVDGYCFERNLVCDVDFDDVTTPNLEKKQMEKEKSESELPHYRSVECAEDENEIENANMEVVKEEVALIDDVLKHKGEIVAEKSKNGNKSDVVYCDSDIDKLAHSKRIEKLRYFRWLYPALTAEVALAAWCGGDLGLVFFRVVEMFVRTKVEASILEIASSCKFIDR